MLGDREIDESPVAELVTVSQTSVDRTSVSLLLTAASHQEGKGVVMCWGGGGGRQRSEVRGVGWGMQDITSRSKELIMTRFVLQTENMKELRSQTVGIYR